MKTVVSLVVVFFLAGCATYPSVHSPPPYVVKLTSQSGGSSCTGVLIDRIRVVGALHCVGGKAWSSNQYGQLSQILYVEHENEELDLAVVLLLNPLYSPYWATFKDPTPLLPAFLYGNCPVHWTNAPRAATWAGKSPDGYHVWIVDGCGGDSGAPLIQGAEVVGMLQRVRPALLVDATRRGTEGYARPGTAIRDWLVEIGVVE